MAIHILCHIHYRLPCALLKVFHNLYHQIFYCHLYYQSFVFQNLLLETFYHPLLHQTYSLDLNFS